MPRRSTASTRRAAWFRCRPTSSGPSATRGRSPISSPRTRRPARSSARSPASTISAPSAIPSAAPRCGAWPSIRRRRSPASARRWSAGWPSISRRAASAYLDLSVLHDNEQAIALYEKLGFVRVPMFALKRRNPINEKLFAGPAVAEKLNPYATIIVNEARRRGIAVEVTDAEGGFFRLTYGGRSVHCRESLSEFTSGVAMSICDDKAVTRRVVERRRRRRAGADRGRRRRRRGVPRRSTARSWSSRRAASRAAASPSASSTIEAGRSGDRRRAQASPTAC